MYSQTHEEKYILKAVSSVVPDGHFLDIGAWHAKDLSNTRALYELGWSGVLVEPSPEPFLELLTEYGKDPAISLIHAAVGTERAITKFHRSADALSTSHAGNYAKWEKTGCFDGQFFAPVVTLREIIDQFGPFDFVSIDAEGSSVDLLHSLLAAEMRPDCLCVEYDDRAQECMEAAAKKGYHAIYTSSENVVFAR